MAKILLIEDNDLNRDLISRYLKLHGHVVQSVADGESGLFAAENSTQVIDVILMDLHLPDIDGWQLSRRLKTQEATSSLPIIAVTAHAMVGDRERALKAGCDEYVTKPINFKELLIKIEAICEKVSTV